jgi:SAM-dependent methyltransferase
MIRHAQTKFPEDSHIHWLTQDIRDFVPRLKYPLVISSSALHWIEQPLEAIQAVDRVTAPGGLLLLSMMLRGTLGELHACRSRVAPSKMVPHRLPPLSAWVAAGVACGWQLDAAYEQTFTAHYASTEVMLKALHRQGVTGGSVSRAPVPLSRSELAALKRDYQLRHGDPLGGVRASFQVGFMAATKP